jgi:hypothetical protein
MSGLPVTFVMYTPLATDARLARWFAHSLRVVSS